MRTGQEYNAKPVCVKPCDVKQASELLSGSRVLVGTVISFPHGNSPTSVKVTEALQTVADGAIELDVVLNIGQVKSGQLQACQDEIKAVIDAYHAKNPNIIFKIIFENAYLTKDEIVQACKLSVAAGAHFVKTSTGFAFSGATLDDIALMRANAPDLIQVKASGGIKTLDPIVDLLNQGATRCGSSTTYKILNEFKMRRGL